MGYSDIHVTLLTGGEHSAYSSVGCRPHDVCYPRHFRWHNQNLHRRRSFILYRM